MLFKSLEFKNFIGQKVKVIDIPVLQEDSPHFFMIQVRLQTFITILYRDRKLGSVHSFRDYLKRTMKWPEYERLFTSGELKNNA
ncbi:DUF2535 family protein [Bacillus massilinigeriensis]|uniref:DUF2535 family protein n=1 Tax=Bacillus mediterraneensis TaxID=1805474 RepID=UPI0008F80C5F|nr:DUF2535 family protein [Bacillus mediterraneensis]